MPYLTSAETPEAMPKAVCGRGREEPPDGLSTSGTRMEFKCGLRVAWQAQGCIYHPKSMEYLLQTLWQVSSADSSGRKEIQADSIS